MPSFRQSHADLERLAEESVAGVYASMRKISAAAARKNPVEIANATEDLAAEIADMVTLANLTGRSAVIFTARAAAGAALEQGLIPADPPLVPVMPSRGLPQSVRALMKREPVLAADVGGVAAAIEQGSFTVARASSQKIVERVQKALKDSLAAGDPTPSTVSIMADTEDWTRAYSENVVRTNQARAYDEGIEEMVKAPAIYAVTPAFRWDATNDPNVRPNHWAANGFIADVNDPTWNWLRVPLGYECRCARSTVTRSMLRRLDLLNEDGSVRTFRPPGFSRARPDKGFVTGGAA